jgi:hypothetical protein
VNSRCADSRRPAGSCTFSRRSALAIDPDAHRVAARAVQTHACHTRQHAEPLDQHALGVVGQLERTERIARQVEVNDRLGARIGLGDLGRLGFLRQVREDAPDAVADVVRGGVDVAVRRELEIDGRGTVDALGRDLRDALETRDAVLDDLCDLRFDHVGRSSGVFRLDRDDRRLHVGQLADRQTRRCQQAEDHEQQAHHGREDRAANRDLGQFHVRSAAGVLEA